MMTCREVFDSLGDYLDRRLGSEQRRGITGHLDMCPECRHYYESYRTTVAAVRASSADAPAPLDEGFVRSILKKRRGLL